MTPSPSARLAASLARILLRSRVREYVLGDLAELHAIRARRDGPGPAGRRYLRDVLRSAVALLRLRGSGAGASRPPHRVGPGWSDLPRELRMAMRSLVHEPGFSIVAIGTLALGIGAASAVFGMANQLVLRPLPGVSNTAEAMHLRFRDVDVPPNEFPVQSISLLDFDALRERATLLDGLASYGNNTFTLTQPDGRPSYVRGRGVYGDFFEVLGVEPLYGRMLRSDETHIDSDPLVAVISERIAESYFGLGTDPVGRTIVLNDQPVTVIGVAADGFNGPERGLVEDLWVPHGALVPLLGFTRERLLSRGSVMHSALLALPFEGADPEAIQAQVAQILGGLAEEDPEPPSRLLELEPVIYEGLHSAPNARAGVRSQLGLFAAIGAIVLLIACANVANLLLARNVRRRADLATRRALGASAGRIARHQLARSLVLGLLGSLFGLAVAWFITFFFEGQALGRVQLEGFSLDLRVLSFAAAAAILSSVVFGTGPALLAGRFDLDAALRVSGDRATRRTSMLGVGMSAIQMALTLSILTGAVLLGRTVQNLYAADLGISIEGVSEILVRVPGEPTPREFDELSRSIIGAVGAVPGVEAASVGTQVPHIASGFVARVRRAEQPDAEPELRWAVGVAPGWFDFFGVEVIEGRTLQPSDWDATAPRPMVITESMARSHFGTTQAIGHRLAVEGGRLPGGGRVIEEFEVVGVVSDTYGANDLDQPRRAFFVTPGAQGDRFSMSILARTQTFDADVADRIRDAVAPFFPDTPIDRPAPMTDRVDTVHRERRLLSRLLTIISAFAVGLSAIGLYGVVAFEVAGRRREFGIRSAIGASAEQIAGLVARHAGTIVAVGTLLGLGGAYLFSRLLEARLFRVSTLDPASYFVAALILAAATAAACVRPAIEATRSNPVVALRSE